ncbi:hypothetical protein K443DRAFT_129929 [Laccaria amethystina LaAM-08-1]|uniref:Ion transport domain-containing protein n=1 Tax=Laccaria amethystina LaAM-08-1 TaxID=1095629 RepID=A0A0C9XMM1_9AGAR|nr:hypothetical protein K443DRAFT_129929 [Laccaria amethystina LaAM-08-1]
MAGSFELTRIRPPPLNSNRFTEEYRPPSPEDVHDVFPLSTSYDDHPELTMQPPWKRALYELLEQPTSSPSAFLIHMVTTILIVVSAVVTVLETVPTFHSISTRIWFGVETTLVALFTVEYIARCVAWSSTWMALLGWIFSFYGVIDLLSVLPYYIEVLLQQDTSVFFRFSILRMFRLLRVFRPFRYNHTILLYAFTPSFTPLTSQFTNRTIEVMYLSVRRSQHALLAIGFFVVMILTVFSTLLYFAERGTWDEVLETFINSDGDPTQFSSIPAAAWFVLVTITTVGYGEITPRSFLGRLVTLPILVFGLLLITLPSFVLGREFSLVWEKMTLDRRENDQENPDSPIDILRQPLRTSYHQDIHSASASNFKHRGDLSNLKLAQNQTELSTQIGDLREQMEAQGRSIERLLALLEGRPGGKPGKERAE